MTTAPGVHVTTSARPRTVGTPAPDSATVFVRQPGAYGTLEPRLFTFADLDGPRHAAELKVATIALGATAAQIEAGDAAFRTLFAEGAQRVYYRRVVGDAATSAAVTFTDGTDPVITIRARYLGAYGNHLKAHLQAGTASGKKLTITDPDGMGLIPAGGIVLDNLADANAVAAAIAANPTLAAELVTVIANGQGATVPTTPGADTALSGGDDDFGGTQLATPFPPELGPGAILGIELGPTNTADSIAAQLIADAEEAEVGRRIVLTSVGPVDGPVDYTAFAALLDDVYDAVVASTSAERAEELLGYIVVAGNPVLAPSRVGPINIIAQAFVAGVRARTIATYGPHRAPAGEVAIARYVLGPSLDGLTIDPVDDPHAADIAAAGCNAIRTIAGTTRNYGWQTLARTAEWLSATNRDALNVIASEADARAETIAFRPIDGKGAIFADLNAILVGVAEDYKAIGAIYPLLADDGTELDPGYTVDTGSSVNTVGTIAAGEVNGRLGVRIAPTGAIVNIDVAKVAVGATF